MNRWPLTLKATLILIGVVVVVLALLSYCSMRRQTDTLKDQGTLSDARTATATDTLEVLARNAEENSAAQAQLETIQDEIRSEPDPAARDRLARQRLCQLQGRSPC